MPRDLDDARIRIFFNREFDSDVLEFSCGHFGREFKGESFLQPPATKSHMADCHAGACMHLKSCMLCSSGRPVDSMSENSV